MTNTTTTELYIKADDVRYYGISESTIRQLVIEGEFPATVLTEPNWEGKPAIVVSMTHEMDEDGDASMGELIDTVERAGIPHSISYGVPAR